MSIFDQFADDYENENGTADDSELNELNEQLGVVLRANASRIRKEMAALEQQKAALEQMYADSLDVVADKNVDRLRAILGETEALSGVVSKQPKKAKTAQSGPKGRGMWRDKIRAVGKMLNKNLSE